MQRRKRHLCLLLAFSLLLVFPIRTITAAEPDPNKPTLYVDYLGSSVSGPETATSPPGFTSADIGKLVWIGVSVDEIWKLELVRTVGAFNLDIGLEYNPAVLQPAVLSGGTWVAYDTVANAADAETGWLDAVQTYNFSDGVGTKDSAYWDSSQYELMREASISGADSIDEDFREYPIDKRTKLSFVGLKKTAVNSATNRFAGVTTANTGRHYLIRMPFVIKSIPASGNPLMLSLSPSTFVLGVDANGWESYGAWEWYAAQNEDDAPGNNLKWMFNLADPLNLFNTVDAALNDLQVWGNNETTGTNEVLPLYSDTGMATPITFDPDVTEYYVNVPHGQRAVDLYLSATDPPAVKLTNLTVTDQAVAVTLDTTDSLYKTDCRTQPVGSPTDLTVVKLDTGQTIADSFQNHFTISIGGNVYNVYVRRLDQPRIELAYGNSPYGMIMRDESIKDKVAAKNAFDIGNAFDAGFLPQNAPAVKDNITYTLSAWFDNPVSVLPGEISDPLVNLDRNDTALFIYNWRLFSDPGFQAINSIGQDVTIDVIREITLLRAKAGIYGTACLQDENVESETIKIFNSSGVVQLQYDNITYPGSMIIQPGKYRMRYYFTDPLLKQDVEIYREIAVLMKLGDTTFDDFITGQDADAITTISKGGALPKNSIYTYRVMDTTLDSYITGQDGDYITTISKGGAEKYLYPNFD